MSRATLQKTESSHASGLAAAPDGTLTAVPAPRLPPVSVSSSGLDVVG